jgi:SAM-dependent methyltransferase
MSVAYYGKKLKRILRELPLKKNRGFCPVCEQKTVFVEYGPWLRDQYKCRICGTIPRNRALRNAINTFLPDWQQRQVHESSPGGEFSYYLKRHCPGYTSSHYYADVPRGELKGKHRSEDLTQLTFPDASFDLFVTSDVFEHVFHAEKAFAEISRVLKPGGMHIFSMPWYPKLEKSELRAKLLDKGQIEYLKEPDYHRNPVDEKGSLVTTDWGRDFCDIIYKSSGMTTTIYVVRDRNLGIDGEFLEIFVSRKN